MSFLRCMQFPGAELTRLELLERHLRDKPRHLHAQMWLLSACSTQSPHIKDVHAGSEQVDERQSTGHFLLLHMPQLVTFDMLVEREAALLAAGARTAAMPKGAGTGILHAPFKLRSGTSLRGDAGITSPLGCGLAGCQQAEKQ